MKHFITCICYLLLVCMFATCDARSKGGRSHGYRQALINSGYLHGYWNPPIIDHINAYNSYKLRKHRSADLGLMETTSLPCKFETYDTNEDGEITLDEFENKLVEMGFEDRQYSIFTALDSDDDGKITQKEFDLVTPGVANDILFPECVKTIYNYMQP